MQNAERGTEHGTTASLPLCQRGCGRPAVTALRTRLDCGHRKGQPRRFCANRLCMTRRRRDTRSGLVRLVAARQKLVSVRHGLTQEDRALVRREVQELMRLVGATP